MPCQTVGSALTWVPELCSVGRGGDKRFHSTKLGGRTNRYLVSHKGETTAVLLCSGAFVAAMTVRYQLLLFHLVCSSTVLSGTSIVRILLLAYVRMTTSFPIWCKQLHALQRSARYSTNITQHSAEQTFQHLVYDTSAF